MSFQNLLRYYSNFYSFSNGPLILFLGIYLAFMLLIVTIKKDRSIANFTWGGGVLLIALYTFIAVLLFGATNWRSILITSLTALWAGRILSYVYLRYRGDDPRYQTWKQGGIKALIINCGYIFILQALLMIIMALPVFVVNNFGGGQLTYLDYLGLAIWLIGFYFEAVSDYQLFKFTRDPANKGKVMQYGLWRYSRHPNYFGEVLMWWGIFLIALNVPYGLYTSIAPITITFLLLFVTGIPWIEKAMAKNPEYQEYKKHTSIFIPWFPH